MATNGKSPAPKKKVAAKKKTAAKKAPAKKVAAKKAPAKKAPAKKAAVKKAAAKKAPAKKAAAKKKATAASKTTIVARIDTGFGNELYVRGEGGGLSWDEGILMECSASDEWTWSTTSAKSGIVFKFLLNDQIWSLGEDLTVPAGGTSVSTPDF